ncbi:hypothetical protein Nepgr_016140 [Nepenthes gracilis]|uniref:Fe2OG dioxygenase domain-containing protein n=1 Tax=Nepenthes gracilis TaxID=150966 RepID=A0AAD3SP83_NEPGR|nr:hypothetical protein Nepgr_016140 [Nepenthes gracilis]
MCKLKNTAALSPKILIDSIENQKMAQVTPLKAEILLATRVQEMVLHGKDPPQPYKCREAESTKTDSPPLAEIPTIDLSQISSPHSHAQAELGRLKSALCSWGSFQAVGHGISSSFLNEMRQVAREFFEQPMEEKARYAKGVTEMEGYGADPVPEEGQPLDWQDRLFLDVYPHDKRNPKFWPEKPASFRRLLEECTEKMRVVIEVVSKAMANSLNIEENCFLNAFGERATLQARFNYYSRSQFPDLVLGIKSHADGSGYTFILQDDVEGLQVLKNDCWYTVPVNPQAILVLMGDQMEIMTNGIFKSPVHRVLTNSERERISIAVFYTPEPGKEIGPVDGLVDEDGNVLYKKMKDYGTIHWDYYQKGLRAIHLAQI